MTNNLKWYHYGMISWTTQLVITCVAAVGMMIQMAVYQESDAPVMVFAGDCDIVTNDGEAMLQCGEYSGRMEALTASQYLNHVISTGEQPSVYCERFETNYLNKVSWDCNLKDTPND
jgi:hypothetical protein